ncbi:MAG: sensor domain-containing protein [Mycobacterium sp.]
MLTACESVTAGTARTDTRPAPPIVLPNQIESVLPPVAMIKQIVDEPELLQGASLRGVSLLPDWFLPDSSCAGSLFAAAEPAYAEHPPMRGSLLTRPRSPRNRSVTTAVLIYHTPRQAEALVARMVARWRGCANKTAITNPHGGPQQKWTLGTPGESGPIHTLYNSVEGGGGYGCARGIASENNVVSDIENCGTAGEATLTEQAVALVDAVIAKIPT